MITTEFKSDIIDIMHDVIFQIESCIDENEAEFLIGLMSYISNQLREYVYSRSLNE